jgi:Flp pilus assembly protein TadD/ADP-heptose:LPS heptosyltransferase
MQAAQNKAQEKLFHSALEKYKSGAFDEAIMLLRQYTDKQSKSASANYYLGLCLSEQWQLDTADKHLRKAIALDPNLLISYSALGTNLVRQQEFKEAESIFRKALKIDPNHSQTRFNLAFLLLLQGLNQEGWKEYTWRLQHPDFSANSHNSPVWEGQPLKDKTLLLLAEQGFGDIIQGLRYVKKVKKAGTLVAVEAHSPLVPLLQTCKDIDLIIAKGAQLPEADYHIPIMDIPAVLQEQESDFSSNYPYLQLPQSRVDEWRKHLGSSKKLRIGIAWQGNPAFKDDRWRSIPLAEFSALAQMEAIELVSLQKGETGTKQIKCFKEKYALTNIDESLDKDRTFLDTATLMANMDLIICSDSAVAHLAGALGIPTWLLINTAADWRWLLKREDSPWYPSIRLFRQNKQGDWPELFHRVQGELVQYIESLKQQSSKLITYDDSLLRNLPAWYQQAVKYYSEGKLDDCQSECEKILAVEPRHFQANELLGMLFSRSGKYKKTVRHLKRVILMNPRYTQAMNNCGLALCHLNRFSEAEALLKRAAELNNNKSSIHHNLGMALLRQDKFVEAANSLEQAIRLNPGYAESHHLLSLALDKSDQLEKSLASIKQAIELLPNQTAYYAHLIQLYIKLKQTEDYQKAIEGLININSGSKERDIYIDVGILLFEQGEFEASIEFYRKAIALDPESAIAHNNLGHCLSQLNPDEEAENEFRKALSLEPNYIIAHFNLAIHLLKLGKFEDGWQEYRWRTKREDVKISKHDSPEWNGEDLTGRSIIILAEQGFGDIIQAARYLKRIRQNGTKIILECPGVLTPLFSSLPEVDQIIYRKGPLPAADFHIPILNIPAVLQDDVDSLSTENAYLSATPKTINEWQQRLGSSNKFRVGIVWQGSPSFKTDRWRSIPLNEFSELASIPEVELVSLQKGEAGTNQIADFQKHYSLLDVDKKLKRNRNFMDTAAIICNMDLVITSDTSVAHLAGALGAPTWVLLSANADWRWMVNREDSPWYPSMRLFRQNTFGDWQQLFKKVKTELQLLIR